LSKEESQAAPMIQFLASSWGNTAGIFGTHQSCWLGWIDGWFAAEELQQNAWLGTAHKRRNVGMAQSGYLYLEDSKWKVRYRIKDDNGNWGWAPVHVLGTRGDYPNRSEAKIAKDEFMDLQNQIGFRAETGAGIVEFVEQTYFPDIETTGLYCLDPSTVKTYRGYWRKHLEPELQGRMIRTFRPCHAEQVMVRIAEKTGDTLAHGTYSRIKSSFSAIFTHAIRKGLIHENPVSACSVPRGKPFGRRCYACSLSEVFQHLQLFDGQVNAIIATAAFAGLREGELRGLWSTDDMGEYLCIRRSVWRGIVKDKCKTLESGCDLEPAEVPIIKPLRRILDGVSHGSSWLFPNSLGGPIDLSNVADRTVKPALKKVGLNWWGWHAYRRGLASNLKDLGIDDLVIQQILRHNDVGTTRNSYIKVRNVKVEDAMRQLGQAFEACTAFVQPSEQPKLVN
jgi:integrase